MRIAWGSLVRSAQSRGAEERPDGGCSSLQEALSSALCDSNRAWGNGMELCQGRGSSGLGTGSVQEGGGHRTECPGQWAWPWVLEFQKHLDNILGQREPGAGVDDPCGSLPAWDIQWSYSFTHTHPVRSVPSCAGLFSMTQHRQLLPGFPYKRQQRSHTPLFYLLERRTLNYHLSAEHANTPAHS